MNSDYMINTTSLLSKDVLNKIRDFSKKTKSIDETIVFLSKNFSIDITTDPDIISGYDQDWSNITGSADALCRPKNEFEVSIIIKLCYNFKIPVTISAGRTNLTGSATPEGGMIISIAKINDLGKVDNKNKNVICSPGVYVEDLRNHVLEKSNKNLIFPVDPTSRKEAMIGGAISCNASGFVPGEKGAMRYWVESLQFILPNGECINANRGDYISNNGKFIIRFLDGKQQEITIPKYQRVNIKNASGPFSSPDGKMDFIDLIIGSEGIFGFISESKLNLQNRPSDYLNLFVKLKNEAEALDLYFNFNKHFSGDMSILSGFEYFGENCSDYMIHKEFLFDKDYNVGVYIQIPIHNEDMDSFIERWYDILMNFECITDGDQLISLNEGRNWRKFFEARHSMPANALQKAREYKIASIITDTIVPPQSFEKFLNETHKLIKNNGIDYLLFGHLGDCHLHFHLIPNNHNENVAIECYRRIIKLSSDLGGVYSAEHGTGKRKKQDFLECYGVDAANEIRQCKKSFDPFFILNRGNVIDY